MRIKLPRTDATVKSETVVIDKQTGKVSTVQSDTSSLQKIEELASELHEATIQMEAVENASACIAYIKVSNGVTLSMGYQSVRVDVGVELPWMIKPGTTEGLREGFDKAYAFLDDELAERTADLDTLLRDLCKKYSNR